MTKARLNRLMNHGKCFDVAVDHGFFNEVNFLNGIQDMSTAVKTLIGAAPDAIQLTVGMAHHLQDNPNRSKPSLVVRTDVANVYGSVLPRKLFSHLVDNVVEQAVVLDAACVVVNLLMLPDQPELHEECVANISRLRPICTKYGMPLMVEPLVMQSNSTAGGYMVDGDLRKILPLVRQAVELGADIIKADPCDDVREYSKVIEIASGCPVLVRGGGKASEVEIFDRTVELMKQGASGIVYGRNVIQHDDPAGMVRALMAIVHESASAESAMGILKDRKGR